jgi:hypothetical protein
MINVERARALLEYLKDQPLQHEQGEWIGNADPRLASRSDIAALRGHCGTVGCVAGWAVLLFGDPGAVVTLGREVRLPDGRSLTVARYAMELLDFDNTSAGLVFYANEARAMESLHWLAEHADASSRQLEGHIWEVHHSVPCQ